MKTTQLYTPLALLATALALAACSDSGDGPSGGSAGLSVGDSLTGLPASEASDLQIRQKAAANASRALGINLSDAFGTQIDDTEIGETIEDPDSVDEELDGFMQTALGLDGNNADIVREGNLISIDLDDNALCDATIADRATFIDDYEECLLVAQQLMVEVDAITDDTGRIQFLFQEQPVVSIGYAPGLGSYELSLPGYYQLTSYISNLRGLEGSAPETLTGALLVEAELEGSDEAVTAARLSLRISQALRLADSANGTDIAIGQSEIVSLQTNDDDTVSVSTDMGAINAMFDVTSQSGSSDGFNTTETFEQTSIALAVSAITAQLNIGADGQSAQLRNAGFGNSPLSLQIDGEQAVSLTLNDVSMTLSPESLDFDSNMTLGLMLGNTLASGLTGDDSGQGNASVNASVSIPSGSSMIEQDNGSIRVDSGSVSVQVSATGDAGSINQSFDASAGQCFDTGDEDMDDSDALQLVDCDSL